MRERDFGGSYTACEIVKQKKTEIKGFSDAFLWIMNGNFSVTLSDSGKINISFQLFSLPSNFLQCGNTLLGIGSKRSQFHCLHGAFHLINKIENWKEDHEGRG